MAGDAASPAPRGGIKFQYASGSKPLEGYTIKRGIGRGGFGEVYFATSDAGKEVALKHVERNLEVELRGVSQCLNLKHANLIDLYDVRYDEQGDAWIVMEFVGGPSLKDVIDRNPNGLPIDQVLAWFRGIAAGAAYLHDHGIVHRDLKPGNIFDDAGTVNIGDYGLSKFISTSRRSGQTESVGTFHYMAPEIGKGVYGKEIDIYALGIILYEMLTGRVPFEGESSQEIMMKHLTADPDLSNIAQPYRAVIQRAMQKDPDKRFATVGEMLVAVEAGPPATKPPAATPSQPAHGTLLPPVGIPIAPPVYIGVEDAAAEGISFGPVQQHVPQKVPAPAQPAPRRKFAPPLHAPREPIAAAVAQGWTQFADWWNHGPINTPLKIVILLSALVLAIFYGGWLLPAAAALGAVYLLYLGIRLATQALNAPPIPARDDPAPGSPLPQYRSAGWTSLSWEQQGRELLRMKTPADRIGELTGSMLGSALIAAVLTVVMTTLGGQTLQSSANPYAGPAWLWLATTLGSWLLLGAGKFLETGGGEMVRRRFLMLVLGLVFGAVAFALGEFLMVRMYDGPVPGSSLRGIGNSPWVQTMFDSVGQPKLLGFVGYFGAIFLTIGWWKQTDPLRPSRMRIGPILLVVLAAWVWECLIPFPQPWGFMTVTAIAIATQLSAPWLSPAERTAAARNRRNMV
ncbi:MAG: protein kinase [Pirellulaceae bacterium]|nr:protein kinase [Pirellulaceae bacterium]